MRVLHFYKAALPESHGGVESFIDTLCRSTSALGVDNSVLALSQAPSKSPINMGNHILHQVKQNLHIASTGFSLSAIKAFKKLSNEADIIHYHFPYPFADLLHLICNIKKPTVLTYHSDIIKQKQLMTIYRPLQNRFLNDIDRIVATSPNYFVSSNVLQAHSDKVSIIPIGIDINSYPVPNEERLTFWRQKIHADQPFFLFIGAMRYYKGLHVALDAIAGTNIRLILGGINGIENELKAHAAKLGLQNVEFLGFLSEEDKVALLNLCYGFVFPSHLRSEAFGVALLEAAAFGKPMISCEIGTGTSFVNSANETGLVVNPGSATDLRSAMEYLLNNPSLAADMGQYAKQRVKKWFSAEKMAEAYYKIYKTLQ